MQCGCFERAAVELVQLYIGNRGVCAAIRLFSDGVQSFSQIPTFEIFLPFIQVVSSTETKIWFSRRSTRILFNVFHSNDPQDFSFKFTHLEICLNIKFLTSAF